MTVTSKGPSRMILQTVLFLSNFGRAIAGTLTMVTFGYQVVTDNDEYVDLVGKAASLTVASGAPGSTPPDFVPFRKFRSL